MKRPIRRFIWLATAFFLVVAIGFVAFGFYVDRQTPSINGKADGMIVLTGSSDRIPDAIELFSQGRATRMLITGVNAGITRAEIGRLNPKYRELVECCVDLGYEALNTFGNAREARRWAEQNAIKKSLIVVTSNYHMPRALAELHDVLPALDLIPYPVVSVRMREGSWWQSPHAVRLIGTEYVKFVLISVRIMVRKAWSVLKHTIS